MFTIRDYVCKLETFIGFYFEGSRSSDKQKYKKKLENKLHSLFLKIRFLTQIRSHYVSFRVFSKCGIRLSI